MQLLKAGVNKHPTENVFYFVTNDSTYVVAEVEGILLNLHWGPRLMTLQDVHVPKTLQQERSSQDPAITSAREEFPVFGGLRYGLDVLRVEFQNNTHELDLVYEGSRCKKNAVIFRLRDRVHTSFFVDLVYRVDIENDLIIKNAYIVGTNVTVRKMHFAAWHLEPHGNDRTLVTLAGAWSCETQEQRHTLQPGTTHQLQSLRGIPSAQIYPYFAIEDGSEAYFGTISWSGNWSMDIATDIEGQVRITGGYHDRDFCFPFGENDAHSLPTFVAGYSKDGLSGARRRLTQNIRHSRISPSDELSPVLFNGWEACGFDVNLTNQKAMADQAARLGVELFVLDDGWFKGRQSDTAGLGDWYADRVKFPTGLRPLSDHVHNLGMKFGLWLEPEMVNPESDLYREHPDWVYHYPDRPRHLERNQLVLDITRTEVMGYVMKLIQNIVRNDNVDYIKWDMNRPISDVGMRGQGHAYCVYQMIENLKKMFPHLRIETCCSGGGRADLAMLRLTDRCWASDNTRPDARLKIQYGSSLVMPPNLMSCWVTDMPNDDPYCQFPIPYRFHVSFMGALGIGSDLTRLSSDELKEYNAWIELYKKLRPILQGGNLDFLVPPSDNHRSYTTVTQTTLKDSAVVLAFRQASPFWLALHSVRIKHMDPMGMYNVQIWADDPLNPVLDCKFTGTSLLTRGLDFPYLTSKQYSSVVCLLTRCFAQE